MTPAQLLRLAEILAEVRNVRLNTISRWATNGRNEKLLDRIKREEGVSTTSVARAAAWIAEHWPPHVIWPSDIPRPEPPHRCAAQ